MRSLHGVPLASFGRRAAAMAIDFATVGVAFLVGTVVLGRLAVRLGLVKPEQDVLLRLTFFGNWYSVLLLGVYFTLATYMSNGVTLGKRAMRIRVVSLVHDQLTLWHSFERALGYVASTLEFGFGFLQYFIHPNKKTVHDRIAETIVVLDDRQSGADRTAA